MWPVAVAQTPAVSVRLRCHTAYGTRQTVSLSPSCLRLPGDDRSGATIPSQQQASAGLSGDLGGKGAKDRALLGGDASTAGGSGALCAEGDSAAAAAVRKNCKLIKLWTARL